MEIQVVRIGVFGLSRETVQVSDTYFAPAEALPDEDIQRDMLLAEHEMRLLLLESKL
ncbi:MAG TPA: hypothetical protein GX701_09380 [Clostridiales bacterium]|jgi:hypothetical protein|nr:hypothetical protein [Clostridiales bacterium]